MPRGQRDGSLRPYSRISRPDASSLGSHNSDKWRVGHYYFARYSGRVLLNGASINRVFARIFHV
jgi:hypothetical protein